MFRVTRVASIHRLRLANSRWPLIANNSSILHPLNSSIFSLRRSQPIRCFATAEPKKTRKTRKSKTDETKVEATEAAEQKSAGDETKPEKSKKAAASSHLTSYTRHTLRSHILLRPEPYIGSTQTEVRDQWIPQTADENADADADENQNEKASENAPAPSSPASALHYSRMCLSRISSVPALIHIFDEILVNAADNRHRPSDSRQSYIKVSINPEKNEISVSNDGACIPIEIHPTEHIYIPELIFGNLLTSSNYDDSQQRMTGGRHGYGAKLTNIFSNRFAVEISDGKYLFRQEYRDNMAEVDKPLIQKTKGKPFTKITFQPDLKRFHLDKLDSDSVSLMVRRCIDIAACVAKQKISVFLNDQRIPINSFEDFVQLFNPNEQGSEGENNGEFVYFSPNSDWEIAVGPVLRDSGSANSSNFPRDVSFVNCISTVRGGSHVNFIADKVCSHIQQHILKHHKNVKSVNNSLIRANLSIFVNAAIPNPIFNSQTKEILMTPIAKFAQQIEISNSFLSRVVARTGLVDRLVQFSEAKQIYELNKKNRSSRGNNRRSIMAEILKLSDANWAGTNKSPECALILTEGDSAKALVLSNLNVLGRDRFGVFPLKGKLLNVRDASMAALEKNEELNQIVKILGLQFKRDYSTPESRAELRYGRVMLMTDQDHDGSHIKGLFLNIIHKFWPELIKCNQFVTEFVTAIVKANKIRNRNKSASASNNNNPNEIDEFTKNFQTIPEYMNWRNSLSASELKDWNIKYYKGLGTNTTAEGKEYFQRIGKHEIKFLYESAEDDKLFDLCFSKAAADRRKEWLTNNSTVELYVDHSKGVLPYSEFVNREFILFSHADNIRSIPSLVDGLKPVQRKILFGCFKRNLIGSQTKEIKVAQLAGFISEQTGYHHGEMSLHSAIVNIAQDFPGSNNLPLLIPLGQFGSRTQGGKDAASARYIFTKLNSIARKIFIEDDEKLLKYKDEDGLTVEPEYFAPIIPMILVNGAEGIGTGFSTFIPQFNPLDLIQNLRLKLQNRPMKLMKPWNINHKGVISRLPVGVEVEKYLKGKNSNSQNSEKENSIESTADSGIWLSEGIIRIINGKSLEITELPIGRWTQDYKEFLASLIGNSDEFDEGNVISIRSFQEFHTESEIKFKIELTPQQLAKAKSIGLIRAFRLFNSISTRNMHLFDSELRVKRYSTINSIVDDYYDLRWKFYEMRKRELNIEIGLKLLKLANKCRFLESIADNSIEFAKKSKRELIELLEKLKFSPQELFEFERYKSIEVSCDAEDSKKNPFHPVEKMENIRLPFKIPSSNAVVRSNSSFDYLLDLPLLSLSSDRLAALRAELDSNQQRLIQLGKQSIRQMWESDLDALEKEIKSLEQLGIIQYNKLSKHRKLSNHQQQAEVEEIEEN